MAASLDLRRHRRAGSCFRAAGVLAAVLAAAVPALAARLVEVRVGDHPKYTRVVFELDRAVGYQIRRSGSPERPVLEVTLDAASNARRIGANGDVRGVSIEAGPRAVARIALDKSDLRLQEMILANPPRIVLDLLRSEAPQLAAPAAKPRAAAKPAASSEPQTTAAPAVKPDVAPKPASEPKPVPPAIASEAKPAEEPAPPPAPAPSAQPAPAVPPAAEESPPPALADAAHDEPAAAESADAVPSDAIAESPAPDALAAPAQPVKPPAIARAEPKPVRPPPAMPAPAPAPVALRGWLEKLSSERVWQAGIAAALVAVAGFGFLAVRRRRSLPNDLDVAAIAEEADAEDRTAPPAAVAAHTGDSATSVSSASIDSLFDAPVPAPDRAPRAPTAPAPRPQPAPAVKAPPAAVAARPAPAPPAPPAADPDDPMSSLFDETDGADSAADASQGDTSMDQNTDLPGRRSATPPSPPPRMGGSAAPAPDAARMFQQLEARIEALESKLDEANEAREKLERQVAAQSEELRVQRAAIARTQRALRTMSRAEEDKATEPALRDGDKKTRVNL